MQQTSSADATARAEAAQGERGGKPGGAAPKRRHLVRNIVIAVAAAVVVIAGAGVGAYAAGVIMPAKAAAKYGAFDYLDESEVTEYIMTYKEQMGYGDATDDEWASFLASYNLTPDRLRLSTIEQLLSDKAVEKRCADLGITASDEEVDATIETLKGSIGLLDDDSWAETLAMYGQTEEGLRDVYRRELLKQKLATEEVEMPEPSDDQVRSAVADFAASRQQTEAANAATSEESQAILNGDGETLVRHSYCFRIKALGDEVSLDDSQQAELVRQEFMESGMDIDTFATLVALYSNDDETKETAGAMGWDADTSAYSEMYVRTLSSVEVGGVSSVFTDGDYACFIWVDQGYAVPYGEDALASIDLEAMSDSLRQYFSDVASYALWTEASDAYLNNLVASLDVTVYEMPADVPYNVDMSAYLVEEDDSAAGGSDAEAAG